ENRCGFLQRPRAGPGRPISPGGAPPPRAPPPADKGPSRDGKGMLYEGGTRVVGLANWPGHIKPGSVVDEPIHIVDMYPTLARLAGAPTGKHKPLDGMDVWPTISDGKSSPRTEVVYDIQPVLAAGRRGEWRLVWGAVLPSGVEFFNLAQDPGEKVTLADQTPQKVADLQQWAQALAGGAVPPLLLKEALGVVWKVETGSVALP